MNTRVSIDDASASFIEVNFGDEPDQTCPQILSHAHIADRHLWFWMMCRKLWGVAATSALFDLVGQHLGHNDERQCRRWSRGESEPPQSILWLLIRSKEGFRVVRYIGHGAVWMDNLRSELRLAADARKIFSQLETVMK